MPSPTERAIEAVWRIERPKVIAGVARLVRDVGLAEDLAQDALVAALEHWPADGVPDNPAAWLMATAKNRALDRLRRDKLQASRHEELGHDLAAREALIVPDFVDALDAARSDPIGDDLLRLIFTACHPVLSTDARVALTLKLLGGLTTAEISRAFLVAEPTIAQRIVRAKRTLAEARVPFELPPAGELAPRLASVLEVIYLIFNEGYTATAGEDWMRPALCDEAIRLGRVLAGLVAQPAAAGRAGMPADEPGRAGEGKGSGRAGDADAAMGADPESETLGLLALMELQASRAAARVDAQGRPVLLADQDRSRWDRLLIRRGLALLERIEARGRPLGPYALQAAIAACHARAATAAQTDWAAIVALYDALARLTPSPVIDLNRAVAVSMASGPAAALELVDAMRDDPALHAYHWLPSVRGDLLARLGRHAEARAEFEHAATLARNQREREFLLERAQAMDGAMRPH